SLRRAGRVALLRDARERSRFCRAPERWPDSAGPGCTAGAKLSHARRAGFHAERFVVSFELPESGPVLRKSERADRDPPDDAAAETRPFGRTVPLVRACVVPARDVPFQ